MANLIVSATAEWNGKALTKAYKQVNYFEKSIAKLGKTLAGVFAARQIYRFGKSSVQAFIADEAAANKLSSAVTNLGLSLSDTDIAGFIDKLEKQSSVLDQVLRPSFQALLTTTGDVAKSQDLLTKAIDISRGSSVDLSTVSQDLANAYVGITRGLKKYNLGLTQTQLKAASFEQVMVLLNKQFAGASAAYLQTYAGKLDVLKVAADRSKESIGKGLVDALVLAAGKDADVIDVADAMQKLADNTANAIRGVGVLIGKLDTLGKNKGSKSGRGFFGTIVAEIASATMTPYKDLAALGKSTVLPGPGKFYDSLIKSGKEKQMQNAKIKADAKNLAIQKELNKLATAKALKDKLSAQAAKVALLFNQTAISATAALKNKLSEEERNKVLLMLALEMDNTKEAERLAQKVALASDETGLLAQFLRTLPDAKNPFAAWDAYLSTLKADSLAAARAIADEWAKAYQTPMAAASVSNSSVSAPNTGAFPRSQPGDFRKAEENSMLEAPNAGAFPRYQPGDFRAAEERSNAAYYASLSNNMGSGFYVGGTKIGGDGGATVMNYNITLNNPVGDGIQTMVQDAILDLNRLGNNLIPAGSL